MVKLFVLAQMRAISTKLERITVKLLNTVYQQELKPVHPMMDALRSGDPELIVKYSDLRMPDLDKRLLELQRHIEERQDQKKSESIFAGNEQARKLYMMLQAMGCDSDLLKPLVKTVFKQHPSLSMPELSKIVLEWYSEAPAPKKVKIEKMKSVDWHTLQSDDLRFKFSQSENNGLYGELQLGRELFDVHSWLKRAN